VAGLIPIPERLPLWAYIAAGAGAFVVARAALAGAGTVPGPAAAAADPNALPGAATAGQAGVSGGGVWGTFDNSQDGLGSFASQFAGTGVLPQLGYTLADLLGGQSIPVTVTNTQGTIPTPTPQPTPTSTPTPAPPNQMQAPPTPATTQLRLIASPSSPANLRVWSGYLDTQYPGTVVATSAVTRVAITANQGPWLADGKRYPIRGVQADIENSWIASGVWRVLQGPYQGKFVEGPFQWTLT
jgi:hypothetical protein